MRNLVICLFSGFLSFGQYEKINIEIDLLYANTKMFNKNFHGASVGMSTLFNDKTAVGFFLSFHKKDINPTFYIVEDPSINHVEFGIQMKNYLLKTNRWQLSPFLLNSWGFTYLLDQSILEYIETEFGNGTRYARVDINNLFFIQPGVDIQLKLSENKRGTSFFLSSRAMYRQAFGRVNFGYLSDYNTFYFGMGLTIKYTSKGF